MDVFMPVKGKCTWWREIPHHEDAHDIRLKDDEKRINCSCFVEGEIWTFTAGEVPPDCPNMRPCRYYIKHA